MNFFAELKRRNVYKVAVAYAVASWLLIQVATQVFPFFGIPNWVVRLVVLLLILGFPVALILSWAFEITPEGVKRVEDVEPNESVTRQTGRKLVGITMALAVVAAGLFAFQVLRPRLMRNSVTTPKKIPAAASVIPGKSIAVLPFENLSEDKANAYFADGIQDEILTRISKIADLKVISRTSTQRYKTAPEDLPEIARQLGVAHILEGTVQKQGDRVRVNVQLIKAANDSHVWADTYDRNLVDIFSVESEVAKAIADQLRVKLTGREEQVIADKPTDRPEAYDAYLRALAYTLKTENTPANNLGCTKVFQRSGAAGPEIRARLGAALIRRCARLPHLKSPAHGRLAGRGAAGG